MTAKKVSHPECGMKRMQSLPTRIDLSILPIGFGHLCLFVLSCVFARRASKHSQPTPSLEVSKYREVGGRMHRKMQPPSSYTVFVSRGLKPGSGQPCSKIWA